MNVSYKRLHPNATVPTQGSSQAAGNDLYACLDKSVTIQPFQTEKIPTGLSMAFSPGYAALIYARSGLAAKYGIRPSNCVGVCDCDYRGEYIVALRNDSIEPYTINNGDRIAQLVVAPVMSVDFVEEVLDATDRGSGGFGSTGV